MKGSLRTLRVNDHSARTNFNDWSDPQYELPQLREDPTSRGETTILPEEKPTVIDEPTIECIASNTSLKLEGLRERIRRGHPLMTKKEVRDYRLPFHESLLLNLKEDGFLITYEFIKDLIALDEEYHKDPFNNRPLLKFSNSVLIPLSNGLMKAESSKLNDEKTEEALAFLDIAKLFGDSKDSSWYWIALEMFEQCMEVMKNVEKPIEPQLHATSKYFYSSFLFNKLKNCDEAKIQIESSMTMSEGKHWMIDEAKGDNLYMASCSLLHKIFLEMSQRQMIFENTEEAIQLCRSGLLWAKVVGDKSAEIDALQKLINIYLSVEQVYSVWELIESYMKLCTELDNFECLCEGYILSARYHDIIGEKVNVVEDMKNLLKTATENRITKMIAMAHHKLATYYLLKGSDEELQEHSIEAYMSYLNFKKNSKEKEEAKCLVGVAQGRRIMNDYCNLFIDAKNIDQSILFKWKSFRVPFFNHEIVLIPEISKNLNLLKRTEHMRTEENFAHNQKRQTIIMTTSLKRPFKLAQTGSIMSMSMGTDRNYSIRSQTVNPSTFFGESQKYRSFSVMEGNKRLQSDDSVVVPTVHQSTVVSDGAGYKKISYLEDKRQLRSASAYNEKH